VRAGLRTAARQLSRQGRFEAAALFDAGAGNPGQKPPGIPLLIQLPGQGRVAIGRVPNIGVHTSYEGLSARMSVFLPAYAQKEGEPAIAAVGLDGMVRRFVRGHDDWEEWLALPERNLENNQGSFQIAWRPEGDGGWLAASCGQGIRLWRVKAGRGKPEATWPTRPGVQNLKGRLGICPLPNNFQTFGEGGKEVAPAVIQAVFSSSLENGGDGERCAGLFIPGRNNPLELPDSDFLTAQILPSEGEENALHLLAAFGRYGGLRLVEYTLEENWSFRRKPLVALGNCLDLVRLEENVLLVTCKESMDRRTFGVYPGSYAAAGLHPLRRVEGRWCLEEEEADLVFNVGDTPGSIAPDWITGPDGRRALALAGIVGDGPALLLYPGSSGKGVADPVSRRILVPPPGTRFLDLQDLGDWDGDGVSDLLLHLDRLEGKEVRCFFVVSSGSELLAILDTPADRDARATSERLPTAEELAEAAGGEPLRRWLEGRNNKPSGAGDRVAKGASPLAPAHWTAWRWPPVTFRADGNVIEVAGPSAGLPLARAILEPGTQVAGTIEAAEIGFDGGLVVSVAAAGDVLPANSKEEDRWIQTGLTLSGGTGWRKQVVSFSVKEGIEEYFPYRAGEVVRFIVTPYTFRVRGAGLDYAQQLPASPGEVKNGASRWVIEVRMRGSRDYLYPDTVGRVTLEGPVKVAAAPSVAWEQDGGALLRILWEAEAALAGKRPGNWKQCLQTALEALRNFPLPDRDPGSHQAGLELIHRAWRYGQALGRPVLEPF